jgi:hypothetical protein
MTNKKAIICASGQFLTDQLPDEFHKWNQVQRLGFIEEHKWQPFEYWDAEEIYEEICDLANTLVHFAENYNK